MIASKAAVSPWRAPGGRSSTSRPGATTASRRRVAVARASYVGGAAATSLVEAGRRFGLALSGTMAHSFVMAHDHEVDAFRAYLRQYGPASVLLVDTYDTRRRHPPRRRGHAGRGGDGPGHPDRLGRPRRPGRRRPRHPRRGRLSRCQILVSGDLDEDRIAALLAPRRADRCLRGRHPARHQRRRPLRRHGVQAGRTGWRAPAQAVAGQAHAAGPQAGVAVGPARTSSPCVDEPEPAGRPAAARRWSSPGRRSTPSGRWPTPAPGAAGRPRRLGRAPPRRLRISPALDALDQRGGGRGRGAVSRGPASTIP